MQQPSKVQIVIYNRLGKQVDMIEKYQPQGRQKVEWNCGSLPSGIYYIHFHAGSQTASGKMVVVR
ncbi:MAG: T9SS type A sorting domain-containing protein [Chlorobi bacterium]|nr:T9SS type A sorting domain-containing protein [Chlorobiota bacterium]